MSMALVKASADINATSRRAAFAKGMSGPLTGSEEGPDVNTQKKEHRTCVRACACDAEVRHRQMAAP